MHVDSVTFGEMVAMGLIEGASPFSKMGSATPVNATEVDMWSPATAYVFPTVAQQMEVVSSNAADAAEGTGVRTVKIWYLDSNFVEKTDIVTLNGATPVATNATDIYRINNFWAYTAGTGLKAAGNIDIRHLDNTPIYSRIGTGQTRARNAMYTVPEKTKLFVSQLAYSTTSSTDRNSQFVFRSTYNSKEGSVGSIFYPYSEIGTQDGTVIVHYDVPMVFPAGNDIKVSAIAVANAACVCAVQYRGWTMRGA